MSYAFSGFSVFLYIIYLFTNTCLFSQPHNNRLTAEELYSEINKFLDSKQYDSVPKYNNYLLQKSQQEKDNNYLGKYYYFKSYYLDLTTSQKDSIYYYAQKAIGTFEIVNDSLNISKLSLFISQLENEAGSYHGSISSALKGLKYFSTKEDKKYLAGLYDIIADNYQHLQLYEDAITNQKLAIDILPINSLIYKCNLATIYQSQKRYSEAINILDNLNLSDFTNYEDQAMLIDNLAYYQWLLDPSLNVASQLLRALNIREQHNDLFGSINSYKSLAEYYISNTPKKALSYANKMIDTAKRLDQVEQVLKGLKILMQIDKNDISTRNQYINLKDSLENIRLKTRNQYAKIKYDNAEALRINNELKQQNKFQQLLSMIYGLLALIILGLFVFYIKYSIQKRRLLHQQHEQEKLQEIYRTENKISKKIHDEIANGIYQILSSFQRSNPTAETSWLKKLNSLYDKTRDISHDISEINLGIHYSEELKEMFQDYNNSNTRIIPKGIYDIEWNTIASVKKETLYRVLNELLINMKKHSHATLVIVRFEELRNELNIIYQDNGVGLKTNSTKGTGFKNMGNRISSLQGSFIFDNNYTKGVKIKISFPI